MNFIVFLGSFVIREYSTVSYVAAHSSPGRSQQPVRRFLTHCLICCVIRPSSLNVLAWDLKTHLFAVGHKRHGRVSAGVTSSRYRALHKSIFTYCT